MPARAPAALLVLLAAASAASAAEAPTRAVDLAEGKAAALALSPDDTLLARMSWAADAAPAGVRALCVVVSTPASYTNQFAYTVVNGTAWEDGHKAAGSVSGGGLIIGSVASGSGSNGYSFVSADFSASPPAAVVYSMPWPGRAVSLEGRAFSGNEPGLELGAMVGLYAMPAVPDPCTQPGAKPGCNSTIAAECIDAVNAAAQAAGRGAQELIFPENPTPNAAHTGNYVFKHTGEIKGGIDTLANRLWRDPSRLVVDDALSTSLLLTEVVSQGGTATVHFTLAGNTRTGYDALLAAVRHATVLGGLSVDAGSVDAAGDDDDDDDDDGHGHGGGGGGGGGNGVAIGVAVVAALAVAGGAGFFFWKRRQAAASAEASTYAQF